MSELNSNQIESIRNAISGNSDAQTVVPNSSNDIKSFNGIACSPDDLVLQAKAIRENGKEFERYLHNAFNELDNMHSFWQGQKYNQLRTEFNKIISDLNRMIDFSVSKLPTAIEEIANMFAEADLGDQVTSVTEEAYEPIVLLNQYKDSELRFSINDTIASKDVINRSFENAKEKMNIIFDILGNLSWNDPSVQTLQQSLMKTKTKIEDDFNTVINRFENMIAETTKAIEQMEKTNMLF